MILIKLQYTSFAALNHLVSISRTGLEAGQPANDDMENVEKSIEDLIEDYLLVPNTSRTATAQYLHGLEKQEISEILALYYFFSKLTYDTTIISDQEQQSFWELCCTNADEDIKRIGLAEMIDYLKERTNLSVILSTAAINLK